MIINVYIMNICLITQPGGDPGTKSFRRDRSLRMHSVCPPFHVTKAMPTPAQEIALVK